MARKKGNLDAPKQNANLPQGFVLFSGGDFPPVHDFKTQPNLMIAVDTVKDVPVPEKGKPGTKNYKPAKTTRIIIGVNTETGEEVSAWESAGLSSLIDQIKAKDQVYLSYKGLQRTKDGNNFHKFTAAVKTHDGREIREVRKEREAGAKPGKKK